jgi:E3 ubiquitin-protein ligase ZNF598
MTLFGYGSGRAVIRDSGKQIGTNAWRGSGGGAQQNDETKEEGGEEVGKGKKKGNKGKKQVLMNWG